MGSTCGEDRNLRDQYRNHPWFDYTAEFCERYDQCAFDPDYDTLPLKHFEPMVRAVFEKPREGFGFERRG